MKRKLAAHALNPGTTMLLSRRSVLMALSLILARMSSCPVFAEEALPALEDYERQSGGRIGLYAENLATGAKLAWRSDERFVMCSTFKASLAAAVLARVDRGEDQLAAMIPYGPSDLLDYAPVAKQNLAAGAMSIGELCKAAVEISDNTCANLLLARIGGPAALTAFWRSIGDTISRLDHNEPQLNFPAPGTPDNTTTPAAMAGNMRRLVLGETLSAKSRDQLTAWMVNCKTGGKRLRAGLPAAWRIGDKTGYNLKDAAGDIAVVWPKPDTPAVICAYTGGGSPDTAQLEAVFAAIGRMAGQRLA